ncbi:MAG: hypothetical protein GY697_07680 [Desulfobacterales bacterium]|nr:hypothetical protein [Desulfobacterales bacterium]
MKSRKKVYPVEALADLIADTKITMRKHLNADAMFDAIRQDFTKIVDHRANNRKIPLVDVLMSGFAMFSLKEKKGTDLFSNLPGTTRASIGQSHL